MRLKAVLVLLLAGVPISTPAIAQEGHPLTGSWYGDRGPESDRSQITLVMSWDGTDVTGILNPGPNTTPVTVTLDSRNWTVRIEPAGPDAAGNTVQFIAEGTLEDVGSRNRTIAGTWTEGDTSSDFRVTRD